MNDIERKLKILYGQNLDNFERASGFLNQILNDIVKEVNTLDVRIRYIDSPRIKSFESLLRKSRKKELTAEEVIGKVSDLVGGRVVCNNNNDVEKFVDVLNDRLPIKNIIIIKIDPKESFGYKAFHFDVKVPVEVISDIYLVNCEIQVRTVLQDAWAVLAHADVYKHEDPPPTIEKLFTLISDQLKNIQETADFLRAEIVSNSETQSILRRSLISRIEAEFTKSDLNKLQQLLDATKSYIAPSWVEYLETILKQKQGKFYNNLEEAVKIYEKIISKTNPNSELNARALLTRCAIVDQGYGGLIEILILYLIRSTEMYESSNEPVLRLIAAESYLLIGELERHRDNLGASLDAYTKAVDLAHNFSPALTARAIHRKAITLRIKGQSREAEENHKEALDLVHQSDETQLQWIEAEIYRDMGVRKINDFKTSKNNEDLEQAKKDLNRALDTFNKAAERSAAGICIGKLSRIAKYRGQTDYALKLLNEAKDILSRSQNRLWEAHMLSDLCLLKESMGHADLNDDIARLRQLANLDKSADMSLQSKKYLGRALWAYANSILKQGEDCNLECIADCFLEDLSINKGNDVEWLKAIDGVKKAINNLDNNRKKQLIKNIETQAASYNLKDLELRNFITDEISNEDIN